MQSVPVFFYITKFAEKIVMSAKLRGCVTWVTYFLDLLQVRYNCAKFHHCRICVNDFSEGGLFAPPIREQYRKCSSWIGLMITCSLHALKSSSKWKEMRMKQEKIEMLQQTIYIVERGQESKSSRWWNFIRK